MSFKTIKKGILILISLGLGLSALLSLGMEHPQYQQPGNYGQIQSYNQWQQQPVNQNHSQLNNQNPNTVPLASVADWVCGHTLGGEDGFRKQNGWQNGMLTWNNEHKFFKEGEFKSWLLKNYSNGNQSLLSLMAEGTLEFNTIAALKQKNSFANQKKGRLNLLIDDSSQPAKTDIRALMADSKNNNAVFQIASTPSALEGGMHKEERLLGNMYERATQGEFAAIATMPATLWRKYCLPTCDSDYSQNKEFYLWKFCNKITIKKTNSNGQYIPYFTLETQQFNQADVDSIGVGIHADVPVVVGYGDGWRNPKAQQPIIVAQNQRVTLVLTSAFDFRTVDTFKNKNPKFVQNINGGINQFARTVLDAAYEGTIRSAIAKNKQKVFLTIMGGGSFRNDIAHVYESIEKIANLIKSSGLEVTLVYRPDAGRRPGGLRSAESDKTFLKKFADLIHYINNDFNNGTTAANMPLQKAIDDYCDSAYNKQDCSSQAQCLQTYFDDVTHNRAHQTLNGQNAQIPSTNLPMVTKVAMKPGKVNGTPIPTPSQVAELQSKSPNAFVQDLQKSQQPQRQMPSNSNGDSAHNSNTPSPQQQHNDGAGIGDNADINFDGYTKMTEAQDSDKKVEPSIEESRPSWTSWTVKWFVVEPFKLFVSKPIKWLLSWF